MQSDMCWSDRNAKFSECKSKNSPMGQLTRDTVGKRHREKYNSFTLHKLIPVAGIVESSNMTLVH